MQERFFGCEPARATSSGTAPADARLFLERLALISDDRSRMSARRELDILALMGTEPVSDCAAECLETHG